MRELLAYSQGAVIEEKLTLRIRADNSGDIYLPTAGYSADGSQNCDYDWMVSIDGNTAVEYSGAGSSTGKIRVGYGLNPLSIHTVTVKPKIEEYSWLRAFGYKGTDIANSLINIISDKSYMGYALSDIFTGNYYKAYQYYGCTNLINTDEELLPDTLEVIGDYYRYYEYYGCGGLVGNAEEKILKTVKVIGDYYRAYQYQNCTNINRIDMRAINWASVGNNYRLNQYSGASNDRKPASIYIEGGIEEGGNWGLANDRVKNVYVYEGLVADYQTKLSTITSSKIKKNPDWDNLEYEFIEYIALADSNGEIRIPVGGFSTSFTQNCAYDWMVSVDGGEAEEITGTGGQTYVSVGSDLEEGTEHRVVIKPKTIGWGWGRAFGFHTTGAQAYIKEFIHDSYKCYAVSGTDTGAHYKHGIFTGCTNLINSYEKLPTSVTTIGAQYMSECYAGCTSLQTAFYEVLHKGCTIGADYRYHMYTGCTAMTKHEGIAGCIGAHPSNYKYQYLSGAGNNMDIYITRYEVGGDNTVASMASAGYGTYTIHTITTAGTYNFYCSVIENSNSGGTGVQVLKNGGEIASASCSNAGERRDIDVTFNAGVGDVIKIVVTRYSYGSGGAQNITLSVIENTMGIDNNRVNGIYCFVDDIFTYQNNPNWSTLSSKFKGWYYGYVCNEFIDINRYTKLLATISMPRFEISSEDLGYYDRGIGIDRNKNWSKVSIGATEYGKDSKSNNHVGYVTAQLNTVMNNGYRVVTSATITGGYSVAGSNWSGSNISFFNGVCYGNNGSVYGNYAYNGSNYDYYGLYPLGRDQGGGTPSLACAISRNGKYLWGNKLGWGLFHTDKAYNFSSYVKKSVNTQYGNLLFSDDGLTMVSGNSTWSVLTQYKLTIPRDINTAVSTGKTLSVYGQVTLTSDCKYLFVFNDSNNTLYQYTYV